LTTLDVKELFHADVSPKASFCHNVAVLADQLERNLHRCSSALPNTLVILNILITICLPDLQ
jgi:hypothetical protein